VVLLVMCSMCLHRCLFLLTDKALGAHLGGCVALFTGEAKLVDGSKDLASVHYGLFYLGTYFSHKSIV